MLSCLGLERSSPATVDYGRTAKHKPNPEPLLLALNELEVEPRPEVWYVRDALLRRRRSTQRGLSFAWASYGVWTERAADADSS